MLYLLLGVITVALSVACSRSNTVEQCKWYLNLTLSVLFIIWGFEYFNTVDYTVMLEKYNQVVYDGGINGNIMEIEPGCVLLFYLCSPFGNLFYYIVVALYEVLILRLFIIKYIPRKFFWLLIVLILFQFEYTTVLMTLKRQILAIFTSLLMVYVLLEKEHIWSVKKQILIAVLICFIAFNFHKAAIVTILFIPIWYISRLEIPNWSLYFVVALFFVQYFFDLGAYSEMFYNLIASHDDKFAHYALQIKDGGRETTIIHIAIEFFTFIGMLFSLKYCNKKEKFFLISGIVYLLFINYFVKDSGRILLPFRVCQLFAIPIMVSKIGKIDRILPLVACAMFVLISVKSTYQVYTNPDRSSMTEGFKTFNLIIEAPSLQIDEPQKEKAKYLPYR